MQRRAAIGLMGGMVLGAARGDGAARKPIAVTDRALKLHYDSLVCDGHNDLPWELRDKGVKTFEDKDLLAGIKDGHTDLPRLKKGGIGWQYWSAYVPSSTVRKKVAARWTLEQIDLIHQMVERYPKNFEMASTADDVVRIRKAGKIASMIGVEGGHSIEESLPILRDYYRLGVRYMTLTHSENTPWADSCTDKPNCNGLSKFGEEVVREMNRIGMQVDISHVSPATMKAAIKISKAPVIFSHSSTYALCEHVRNVPDDVLKMLPANGGVVMINFFSGFLTPEAARATKDMFAVSRKLEKQFPNEKDLRAAMQQYRRENPYPPGDAHTVLDHIEHVVKLAGIDHVGLGSDYDGITKTPVQMDDVSTYPVLTQGMLDRGYSEADVRKLLGENALRALRGAEAAKRA
ncbi:MAG TPA: dipeptidase [Planctomycetia bacterium]|nr:dipeptidase [Planctomycetia bacterium]